MNLNSLQLISYHTEKRKELKIDSAHIRKFILSSYRVNCNLIEETNNSQHQDKDIYLQNSILYRESLRQLLNDIDKVAEQLNNLNNDNNQPLSLDNSSIIKSPNQQKNQNTKEISYEIDECIQFYDIIKKIENIWNLCEILFLNQTSSMMMSLELMRWLKVS
jgi:hypothetical protein